jgi:transglutaminase-like putative cysteine protease
MRLSIVHQTVYEYDEPAYDSHNELRLQPIDDARQRLHRFELRVEPSAPLRERSDYVGNRVHYFSVPGAHRRLLIRSAAEVETLPGEQAWPRPGETGLILGDDFASQEAGDEYLIPGRFTARSAEIERLAEGVCARADGDGGAFCAALLQCLQDGLEYVPGWTSVDDSASTVLEEGRGVCQDFAHVAIALAQAAGVPARYVSGYVKPADQPGTASHAWAELFLPGTGRIGLDASHDGPIDERYVRVALGRDYADATPVRGTIRGGGKQALSVDVLVQQAQQAQQ